MSSSTLDVSPEDLGWLRRYGWPVARGGLILLWLGWAGLAWWSAPRPANVSALRADLAANQVSGYSRAENWTHDRGFWGTVPQPRLSSNGALLVWTTMDGRVRYTAPDLGFTLDQLRRAGGGGTDLAQVTGLANELEAAHVPPFTGEGRLADLAGLLAAALGVTGFLMILTGPAPVRGTRPFWFWVGQAPLGLGALAWLAVEYPWSRREPPQRRRANGWLGFAVTLVSAILVGLAAMGLRAVLPVSIVP